jgi:tetratricopeptide (TPR) repeat protein
LPWIALIVILLTTVVTYRGVSGNGLALDDFHTVVTNRALDSLANVAYWFSSPDAVSGRSEIRGYRPVLMASYALDRAVWGDEPFGYHLSNLIVHGAVIVLAFVLARRLWGEPWAAVGAALWVALHPINSEAVNYVTARSSSLMTLWVLAAVWCYDASIRPGVDERRVIRRLQWLAAVMCALLAVGTKEAAAVFPLLFIAWDRARSPSGERWRATVIRSLPFWGVIAIFLVVRVSVLGDAVGAPLSGRSLAQDTLFAVKILLTSFGHWFWPTGLAIDHGWPPVIATGEGALLVAGLTSAGLGTWLAFRLERRLAWCLIWFWTSLLPVLALPFVTRLTVYQENRTYLGGVALAWVAGWVLAACTRVLGRSRTARAAGAALLAVLVVAAIHADSARTAVWVDLESLWEDVLTKHPGSALGYSARGIRLIEAERFEEARAALEQAIRLSPDLGLAHNYLGVLYGRQGQLDRAVAEFQIAIALAPGYAQAGVNLGKAYEQQGRTDLAFAVYERLLRHNPNEAPALGRSGVILEQQGRLAEAADRYRRVVTIAPEDDETREALGALLLRLERWEEAESVFAILVARHPDSASVWFNLGVAHEGLGRVESALDAYQRAADLNLQDPDPYFRMGMIRARQDAWVPAAAAYQRALDRDPRHLLSHINLARVAERQGDEQRAVTHYRAFAEAAPSAGEYQDLLTQTREALARLGDRR